MPPMPPYRSLAAVLGLAGALVSGCAPPGYSGDPTAPLPADLPRSEIAPLAPLVAGLGDATGETPALAEVQAAGDALRARADAAAPAAQADAEIAARGAALRARAAAVRAGGG